MSCVERQGAGTTGGQLRGRVVQAGWQGAVTAKSRRSRLEVILSEKGRFRVRMVDGSLLRFKAGGDPSQGPMRLYPADVKGAPIPGASSVGSLVLSLDQAGQGRLIGACNGHSIEAIVQRQNASDMPLMSRGFHWVSETPYFHMFSTDGKR